MTILRIIQSWRTPSLDKLMVVLFHSIIDEKGLFPALSVLLLLALRKTRKYGVFMLVSVLLSYLVGGLVLKNVICRPRPFVEDSSVVLITEAPGGYSCPSLHTSCAFACSVTLFLYNRKIGIPCLLFACIVGFSRLYFFVHYPSDVLFGAALGSLLAVAVSISGKAIVRRKNARQNN